MADRRVAPNAQEAARRFGTFAIHIAADEYVQVFYIAVLDHMDRGRVDFVGGRLFALVVAIRFLVHHARAGENAGEAVVVALGDRLELVVVAPRASDCEPQHGAPDGVHAIFPFVSHHVEAVAIVIFGAEPNEAERRQVFGTGIELIGSELKLDELIVRQIAVEGLDDPLAVFVGVRIKEFCVVADLVRLVFGVTRERKPEAGHAFAERVRLQEAIDDAIVSVGPFVRDERIDVGWSRRQAGKVHRDPADQRLAIGLGRGDDVLSFEAREDKVIDRLVRPPDVLDLRSRVVHRRAERPELPFLRPID